MRLTSIRSACLAGLLLLLAAGCATPPSPTAAAPAPLLLVSIDGLRPTDVVEERMPRLAALARQGVSAAGMTPSYPSLTFPNHYTLVTGLRPDHHGIVHNSMRVPGLGRFALSDRKAVGDGRWWDGAEPIWVGAEKAGLRTATMYWPGSEAPVRGKRPRTWLPFDAGVAPRARVQQVLAWLDRPASRRPQLVTLYFDQVDHESHEHGPDSVEARAAERQIDDAIGALLDGLSARRLDERLNLIFVSDHGMATVPPGQTIAVEDMVPMEEGEVVSVGQVIGINPRPGYEVQATQRLLGRHDHYQCWRKGELPARWRYGTHPRIPAIVCQMDEGWDAVSRETLQKRPRDSTRGSHGYDPALPSMRATFVARGPAFGRGVRLPVFDNVDVYPLLVRLLGIPGQPNDGDIAPLLPALRQDGAAGD